MNTRTLRILNLVHMPSFKYQPKIRFLGKRSNIEHHNESGDTTHHSASNAESGVKHREFDRAGIYI